LLVSQVRLLMTGWDASVTSAPSLNWPLIFRNASDRVPALMALS